MAHFLLLRNAKKNTGEHFCFLVKCHWETIRRMYSKRWKANKNSILSWWIDSCLCFEHMQEIFSETQRWMRRTCIFSSIKGCNLRHLELTRLGCAEKLQKKGLDEKSAWHSVILQERYLSAQNRRCLQFTSNVSFASPNKKELLKVDVY